MIALDEKKAAAAALEAKKAQSALLAPVAGAAETPADAEYDSDEEVCLTLLCPAADLPRLPYPPLPMYPQSHLVGSLSIASPT